MLVRKSDAAFADRTLLVNHKRRLQRRVANDVEIELGAILQATDAHTGLVYAVDGPILEKCAGDSQRLVTLCVGGVGAENQIWKSCVAWVGESPPVRRELGPRDLGPVHVDQAGVHHHDAGTRVRDALHVDLVEGVVADGKTRHVEHPPGMRLVDGAVRDVASVSSVVDEAKVVGSGCSILESAIGLSREYGEEAHGPSA